MRIDDLITKRHIDKKIDPGMDSSSIQQATKVPNIPSEILNEREIKETSSVTLLKDIQELTTQVLAQTSSLINEIKTVNGADSGFKVYSDLVDSIQFDPMSPLIPSVVKWEDVFVAERDVYRRVVDPRAPFLLDLKRVFFDTQISQYVVNTIWQKIVYPNQLNPDINLTEDRMLKMSLWREKYHLLSLQKQITNVKGNVISNLTAGFIDGFIDNLIRKSRGNGGLVNSEILDKAIRGLTLLKPMLEATLILQSTDWEGLQSIIKLNIGDLASRLGSRLVREQSYLAGVVLQDRVYELISDLGVFFTENTFVTQELVEFQNQVERVLFDQMGSIEDDLIAKERDDFENESIRDLMLNNSQKTAKTKQFMQIVDSAINTLQSLKSYTLNANFEDFLVTRLKNTLIEQNNNFIKQINVKSK